LNLPPRHVDLGRLAASIVDAREVVRAVDRTQLNSLG
jgi:hypothetical protein